MYGLSLLCLLPGVRSGVRVGFTVAAVVVTVCGNTEHIKDNKKTFSSGCMGRGTPAKGLCLSVRDIDCSQ